MLQQVLAVFSGMDMNQIGHWFFLSVGAVALFGIFLPAAHHFDNRRKEREAYYKAEMLRRIAESSGEGAKAAIEVLREEEQIKARKEREGMKIGGLVCTGIGIGVGALCGAEAGPAAACVGLIPGLIGVALLVYVLFLAAPLPESTAPEQKSLRE